MKRIGGIANIFTRLSRNFIPQDVKKWFGRTAIAHPGTDDMAARTRIDANTIQTVNKKGGKVTTTQRSAVSADGKTRTVTTTGTDAQGRTVNNVAVYDRQ